MSRSNGHYLFTSAFSQVYVYFIYFRTLPPASDFARWLVIQSPRHEKGSGSVVGEECDDFFIGFQKMHSLRDIGYCSFLELYRPRRFYAREIFPIPISRSALAK